MIPEEKPPSIPAETQDDPSQVEPSQQALAIVHPRARDIDFEIVDNPTDADRSENASEMGVDAACNEIKRRHRALSNLGRRTLREAIELGDLLSGVKKRLPHGQWYPFLEEAEVGTRAAQNYIALYRRRDDLLSKSAQDADLTIGASLNMYRLSKPRRKLSGDGTKENIVETSPVHPEPLGLASNSDLEEGGLGISTDACEQHEQREDHGGCVGTVLVTQPLAPEALGQTHTNAEAPITDDAADDARGVGPAQTTSPEASIPKIGEVTPTPRASEGFLFVDGVRLHPDRWDDGLIPFKWVQMQISNAIDINNRAPVGSQRSLAALRVELTCLIELARTTNRVLDVTETVEEEPVAILNRAVFNLRNYTNTKSMTS